MCLIIFAPNASTSRIRKVILERGFRKNKDGAGLAYVKDGRVVVSKAYYTFTDFFVAYQRARRAMIGTESPLLIHFRWGTCGPVNHTNTQPLVIYRNQLVMAHNGIFDNLSDYESPVSDSVRLTRIIREHGWAYPFNKNQISTLDTMCGRFSKLVFLSHTGRYTIINERLGGWRRGAWYSDDGATFDVVTIECRRPRRGGKAATIKQLTHMRPQPVKRPFLPPPLPYAHMNTDQKREFERMSEIGKRWAGKAPPLDPDEMDEDDYIKWIHSPAFRDWEEWKEWQAWKDERNRTYLGNHMHEYVAP